jgi:hypothetical protein
MAERQPIRVPVDNPAPTLVDNIPATGSTTKRRVRRYGPAATAFTLALAALAPLAPGTAEASPDLRIYPFSVSATGPDTKMGVFVRPGQELIFKFDERKINTNVNDPNSKWVGAEGNPSNAQGDTNCKRVDAPTGATILAIVGPNGTFEYTTPVRNGSRIRVPDAGEVDLFVNERPDTFEENGRLKNCLVDNGGSTGGSIVQKLA